MGEYLVIFVVGVGGGSWIRSNRIPKMRHRLTKAGRFLFSFEGLPATCGGYSFLMLYPPTNKQTDRQTQTDRQADRQTDRLTGVAGHFTDRQTDRLTGVAGHFVYLRVKSSQHQALEDSATQSPLQNNRNHMKCYRSGRE